MRTGPGRLGLSQGVLICPQVPSPAPVAHAAEYLRSELRRRFRIEAVVVDAAPGAADPRPRVILADAVDRTRLAKLTGITDMPTPDPDGYVVTVSADRRLAVVAGGGGVGVIRGAFALAQLAKMQPDGPAWLQATLSSTPELPIRMTRGILSGRRLSASMSREEADRCQFDWWARWGLNYTMLPSNASGSPASREQEQYAAWYLRGAHDRGMKVGANLGGRSLCPSDADAMAAHLAKARRSLASGCDFLIVLFDDLPSTRTAGHCERCIQRFGGSLAREQRYILESLQEAVESFGPDRQLIWCPTYYSLGMTGYRHAAERPEAYFSILGDSPAVRKTWMYHCAFDRTFNAYLDGKGLTHRIWWYNGIRTPYYMVSRKFDGYEAWGPRLVIPGMKDFHSFFSSFENGWLMPTFAPADPSLHPCISPLVPAKRDAESRTMIPQASWDELHQIGKRMEGVYYCGGSTPYHIAMTGIFAISPQQFDSHEATTAVLQAMFGPAGVEPAIQWQEAYSQAQMILARAQGQPLVGEPLQTIHELTTSMAACESQLHTCIRSDAPALPQPVLNDLLDEMTDWCQRMRTLASGTPTPAGNKTQARQRR